MSVGIFLSIRWTGSISCDGVELRMINIAMGGWYLFPIAFVAGIVSLFLHPRRKSGSVAAILNAAVLGIVTLLAIAVGATACNVP